MIYLYVHQYQAMYIVNYLNIIVMFSFQRPTKGMAALVEEGLKHRRKHQPIEKDTTKPSYSYTHIYILRFMLFTFLMYSL